MATLLALGAYAVLVFTQHWPLELHLVIIAFFLVIWLLFVTLISVRIRHIFYDSTAIQVKNYSTSKLMPSNAYWSLTLTFSRLYRLRTTEGDILFMTSFFDTLANATDFLASEPASIVTARKTLARAAQPQSKAR